MVTDPIPVNFTLSQLEYFIAALEQGSFTAAAESLGVSQPAVAEQVQRLERIAGQSLFVRQARGVAPTRAGADLESHARSVIDAAREAMMTISTARTVGRASVAIGTFASAHHYRLADMLAGYLADNPETRIRVEVRNSSATADAVRAGSLDVAVVALPIDESGLDVSPAFSAEVFYVSAAIDRARHRITIAQFCEGPLILYESSHSDDDPTRYQLSARAQAAGVQLLPRLEVEAADTAVALAAAGLGHTYVPQILLGSLDPRLTAVGFDPPLTDTFAIISRTGSRLSRPVADLVERFTDHVRRQLALSRQLVG